MPTQRKQHCPEKATQALTLPDMHKPLTLYHFVQGIVQQMRVGQLVLLTTSNFQHTRLTPFAPSETLTGVGPHRHLKTLHLKLPMHLNACLEYAVPYSPKIKPNQPIPTKISMAHGRAHCPLLQACIQACPRTTSAHKMLGKSSRYIS